MRHVRAATVRDLRYARVVQVFLIRHANAVDETPDLRDPHRHLTALGRNQAQQLGDRLRWHDCEPTQIWTSPYLRAMQTAELVATGLHVALGPEILPSLAPGEPPRAVIAALHALPETACVVLVGHHPGLAAVGALLVGQPTFSPIARAEAVRIVDDRVRWRFAWDADAPTPA